MNQKITNPIDTLLQAHGLKRTVVGRSVLGWFLSHPDTSYTHAQLQVALSTDQPTQIDRVTLYRSVDRLTQAGLLLCRVDQTRTRRYQLMPASVRAMPHFECNNCHRDSPLSAALKGDGAHLEKAAQAALTVLETLGYKELSCDFAVHGICVECVERSPNASMNSEPIDSARLDK